MQVRACIGVVPPPPFICFEEEKVCSVEDEFTKFIMNLQWNYIEILKNQDR